MDRLYFKFPDMEDRENVLDFKNEFILSGQIMHGVGGLDEVDSYEEWINRINNDLSSETCGEGRVPATEYLAYRTEDNRLVGMLQIRHYLNDGLLAHGGHIGQCVRPNERCKGYGTEQIAFALKECEKLGIERVLLVCDKSNIASARTIQKNNGILENEIIDPTDGEIIQRYWITINNEEM